MQPKTINKSVYKELLFIMEYNFVDIGNRITAERNALGWSQDKLIEELSNKGVKIGRNALSDIENGNKQYKNFSLKLLCALAELFNCEIGYLLCEKEYICKTRCDTDIYKETGLNEQSIDALRMIKLQDKNANSITLFPKKLWKKMTNNEEMTPEDQRQFEEIFFDTSEKYIHPFQDYKPKLMDLFNFILSHNYSMEQILMAFRNLINPFSVPVYFDEKEKKWIYPNNDYSKMKSSFGDLPYTINLARDEEHPGDNLPIYIDNNFLESVNIKSIDNIILKLCQDYRQTDRN
jgi:Predicted transcriptional regulators